MPAAIPVERSVPRRCCAVEYHRHEVVLENLEILLASAREQGALVAHLVERALLEELVDAARTLARGIAFLTVCVCESTKRGFVAQQLR